MSQINRRDLFKLGALSGGAALLGTTGAPRAGAQVLLPEPLPTSPMILSPFSEELPIPPVEQPSDPNTWTDPDGTPLVSSKWGLYNKWQGDPVTGEVIQNPYNLTCNTYYRLQLKRAEHNFTSSMVQPIDAGGKVTSVGGSTAPRKLPPTIISGFNGKFPGSFINARYGTPCTVHFENLLQGWQPGKWADGADFGVGSFLTHLHNGHTSPESDGNPHHARYGYDSWFNPAGANNGRWYCDNMYWNYPPQGDDAEKQSFFWFHDHRLDNTGPNVYSGMVGLYFIYDPVMDNGDETKGFRFPGVPRPGTETMASPTIDYDIPLAFYDVRIDDGVTPHFGQQSSDYGNDPVQMPPQDQMAHPERWGKSFFGHYPNQGFVGDVMTVNGKAYPVMHVKRRKYRLRFLDCSISRWYQMNLTQGTLKTAPGKQGQFVLDGAKQCMTFMQIAAEGGVLPYAIQRDNFQIAPAKRKEFIVDFGHYMDGRATSLNDVVYLTNNLLMQTGRKPDGISDHVPLLKFIIDGDAPDNSVMPIPLNDKQGRVPTKLKALPQIPASFQGLNTHTFVLKRSTGGGAVNQQWMIQDGLGNGGYFDPLNPLYTVGKKGIAQGELWTIQNGGGGWSHPMHLHMEEHRIQSRNGIPTGPLGSDPLHIDDNSKEDVIALEPAETVVLYRRFRSFHGRYVAHCHNLAHEDNSMMFGWSIDPDKP